MTIATTNKMTKAANARYPITMPAKARRRPDSFVRRIWRRATWPRGTPTDATGQNTSAKTAETTRDKMAKTFRLGKGMSSDDTEGTYGAGSG